MFSLPHLFISSQVPLGIATRIGRRPTSDGCRTSWRSSPIHATRIFPCWFQPSSLVTCPTLYTYLMPLWLRGPLSHFVAEIIRSGAMENSAWALRLLTGECSICSYQYNSLPSELPLLHGSGAGTLKGPASVRYLQVPTVGTICVPSSSEDFQSWGHWSQPERHLSQCEAWRLTRRTPSEIYNSMGSHQVIVTSGERWFWV